MKNPDLERDNEIGDKNGCENKKYENGARKTADSHFPHPGAEYSSVEALRATSTWTSAVLNLQSRSVQDNGERYERGKWVTVEAPPKK